MGLEDLTKDELKDKFELFLFNLPDQQGDFLSTVRIDGYEFDYSLDSLAILERF